MRLGEWPGFQGLRIVMLWVILVFVVCGWRYYWQATQAVADETTGTTFHVAVPLLIAFGPPLLFAVGYSIVRGRSRKP